MQPKLAHDLVELFDTPLYVYNLPLIRNTVKALKEQLPMAKLHFAVKANPNGAVLSFLSSQGVGAEVISQGELYRAVNAGISANKIILGGPRQDARLRRDALQAGIKYVSLDSVSQAEAWLTQDNLTTAIPAFFVRVNPALDPRTHPHLATGAASSKFGMTLAESRQVAQSLGKRLAGFHVHAGSQIHDMHVYDEVFEVISELFRDFPQARTLNLGGGFAVPDFPLVRFASKVRAFIQTHKLALSLEPGRYLVAEAGTLITRILHIKEGDKKHLIVDAGMADLLRPALYNASHPISNLDAQQHKPEIVDVDGPLCENADRLAQDIEIDDAKVGDLLLVAQAGAYGLSMGSNYASSLRPAEVIWDGREAKLARRRETLADLVALEQC